jgi:hypothetical protein
LAVGVIATTPIPSEAVFVLALGWIGAIVLRMPQAEWERTGGFATHKLWDFVARRQLHRLDIHAELFRPNGVEYELELGLPAPPWPKVFGFDSGNRDFGERDRLLLDLLRPHLVSLYESAKTRRLAAALAAGAQASGEVVVLDSAARIKFASVSARRLLRDYCDDADRTRLPQAVEDWFLHDRRRLNSDSLHPRGKPLTIDCEHGRLVVTRMNGDNRVLLLVEESVPTFDSNLLSWREWQVLALVEQGKSNAEIAASLWICARNGAHAPRKHQLEVGSAQSSRAGGSRLGGKKKGCEVRVRRPRILLRFSSHGMPESLSKRANPTVRQDRGYGVTSALALVVEAVEALALPLRL